MPAFLARLDLRAATHRDLLALNAAMRREGYTTRIQSDGGIWYELPPGTYLIDDPDCTLKDARDRAAHALRETARRGTILVSAHTAAAWEGLEVADLLPA